MAKKKVNLFAKHTDSTDKTRLSDKSYLDDFIPEIEKPVIEQKKEREPVEVGGKQTEIKRATIVVWKDDLADFRDMIHTIKCSGNYQYTQKDAFARAIELLKTEIIQKHGALQKAPPPKKGRW